MEAESPFHRGLLHMLSLLQYEQLFSQGVKSYLCNAAIVQEHWWKTRFLEKGLFSPLFASVQGIGFCSRKWVGAVRARIFILLRAQGLIPRNQFRQPMYYVAWVLEFLNNL
jgi:hypothetical protein